MLEILPFVIGPLENNTSLVFDPLTRQAAVVDPGLGAGAVYQALLERELRLSAIWLTHAHFDHIGAVAGLREAFPVPVRLHPADVPLYDGAARQAAWFGVSVRPPGVATVALADGERLALGHQTVEVLHTPGHAPGHVAFYAPDAGVLFSGDALFRGSVGRTDLPLCDPAALERSLRERLLVLPDATRVLPGHGPETTIGHERRTNPFVS